MSKVDVVERLRNTALIWGPASGDEITESGQAKEFTHEMLLDAIAEIERLRAIGMHYCKRCVHPMKYGIHSCREYR